MKLTNFILTLAGVCLAAGYELRGSEPEGLDVSDEPKINFDEKGYDRMLKEELGISDEDLMDALEEEADDRDEIEEAADPEDRNLHSEWDHHGHDGWYHHGWGNGGYWHTHEHYHCNRYKCRNRYHHRYHTKKTSSSSKWGGGYRRRRRRYSRRSRKTSSRD